MSKFISHHVMFDVDGTLIVSDGSEESCFREAIYEVLGHTVDVDWSKYTHVTDLGALDQHVTELGLDDRRDTIRTSVKEAFTRNIAEHIMIKPPKQIPGACSFVEELFQIERVSISIATGGWLETASMKLESAGFNTSEIPIASSNDHHSRTEIMKIARDRAKGSNSATCTYFGDGVWDKDACKDLDYNFVLVGNGTSHTQSIMDYTDRHQAMAYIGL